MPGGKRRPPHADRVVAGAGGYGLRASRLQMHRVRVNEASIAAEIRSASRLGKGGTERAWDRSTRGDKIVQSDGNPRMQLQSQYSYSAEVSATRRTLMQRVRQALIQKAGQILKNG